ncbi:50S ribosomal protein L29 [Candidatus Woesearchaeota archaeon]|nr:50S ribosomal protein L29 [Candidatus Woesearchaeota archaeon]
MNHKELKTLPKTDLQNKRIELYKELMKENAQIAIGTLPKNPGKIKLSKKTIARINTLLAEADKKA